MTKLDAIAILTEKGVFDSAEEIRKSLIADTDASHTANRHASALIRTVSGMKSWTQFSARELLDTVTQLHGFAHGLAYSGINAMDDDIIDAIEDLYEITVPVCIDIISMKEE